MNTSLIPFCSLSLVPLHPFDRVDPSSTLSMAAFSLSKSKRDLFEAHFRNQKHMSPHVGPGLNTNIWQSPHGKTSDRPYHTPNRKLNANVPNGKTATGLKPEWISPRKKYLSPEKRDIRQHKHYAHLARKRNNRRKKTPGKSAQPRSVDPNAPSYKTPKSSPIKTSGDKAGRDAVDNDGNAKGGAKGKRGGGGNSLASSLIAQMKLGPRDLFSELEKTGLPSTVNDDKGGSDEPVPKQKGSPEEINPAPIEEPDAESVPNTHITRPSTFGTTPRSPFHSKGHIVGDILISNPYNGLDNGNSGQRTREIEWKRTVLAPNTYSPSVYDPRSQWLKPSFNKNVKKQMRKYKKQDKVRLPNRRYANEQEVLDRFNRLGFK